MSVRMQRTLVGMSMLVLAGVARYFDQPDIASLLVFAGGGMLGGEHIKSSREYTDNPPRAQRRD